MLPPERPRGTPRLCPLHPSRRGTLANVDLIVSVTPLPGGMYTVKLRNGQELDVSRIQSRLLRDRLLQF